MQTFHLVILSFALTAAETLPISTIDDGHDLVSFITHPELKAPLFEVKEFDKDRISPGYWFVAPYAALDPTPWTKKWEPCQVGPYIYDDQGTLIWTGACYFDGRNVFDFKTINIDGTENLSLIVGESYDAAESNGTGLILGDTYNITRTVPVGKDLTVFNMHEFNVIENGKLALVLTYHEVQSSLADIGSPDIEIGIGSGGFREIDIDSGRILFDWNSLDHVPFSESLVPWDTPHTAKYGSWDYLHLNSVDKNADGDYLISARYTDCIYKVSGRDGRVIWRLGGKGNDFVMNKFSFARQHDARFLSSNDTHIIISFLNNGGDESSQLSSVSSGFIVALHTAVSPMTATLIAHYDRPDGGLSFLRGNMQILPNRNVFMGWSEGGYLSEFTSGGTCLMEARFASRRFSTYRAYKFNFTGNPIDPPRLKVKTIGVEPSTATTACYVSWNGATKVSSWKFYTRTEESSTAVLLGSMQKSGFETTFMASGYYRSIWAKAFDSDGQFLGESAVQRSETPDFWEDTWIDSLGTAGTSSESGMHTVPVVSLLSPGDDSLHVMTLLVYGVVVMVVARLVIFRLPFPCRWRRTPV